MNTENQIIEGRGIEKIIDLCDSSGLPQPVFYIGFGGLQLEFIPNLEVTEKVMEKTSEKIIQLLVLMSDVTIAELAEQIGISERSIERNLQNLQKSKKILRIGPDKGGYWKVIE